MLLQNSLLLSSFLMTLNSFELDFNFDNKISEGETQYAELVKKANSYGDCWKKAMTDLHTGCKGLTEEVQSRLALSFSNCFLTHAGSDPCRCDDKAPIANCLKNSSDRVFSTYTEFFTHTQSICHYLQHREWQEEAAKTVSVLTKSSQAVSKKLDESSKSQSKILDLQQSALNEQKRLISSGRILNAELQQTRASARDMYKEFKSSTHEQTLLLFQLFDRMRNLQNFVLGELTGVYTIAYYVILAAFIYIMTSVPRTAGARIWLMLLIAINFAIERILTTHTLNEESLDVNPSGASDLLYNRIWTCRRIMCLVSFIIFIISYYCYKDYNVINNRLLQDIQQQNKELQNFIKGLNYQKNIQNLSAVLQSSTNSSVINEIVSGERVTDMQDLSQQNNIRNLSTALNISTTSSSLSESLEENRKDLSHQKDIQSLSLVLNSSNNSSLLNESFKEGKMATKKGSIQLTARKTVYKKKTTVIRSQGNTPTAMLYNQSPLSELDSPVSQRYNLRSSSRLNSPQLNSPT